MKRTIFYSLLLSFLALCSWGVHEPELIPNPDGKSYMFRLTLTDKNGTPFSLSEPEKFLSSRAIERRRRQGIALDSTDLPVSPEYLTAIRKRGVSVVGQSKWNNTVLVRGTDLQTLERLIKLPFVKKTLRVWTSKDSINESSGRPDFDNNLGNWDSAGVKPYGATEEQIAVLNGQKLHDAGFRGQGIVIAVLDAGFMNADRIPAFDNIRILGTHNFVATSKTSVFKQMDHGTKALSTMAVNRPGVFVGTAPEASYWLLRSEDYDSENIVEEDYWVAAAEFADSVGADIISSSLGYHHFDDSTVTHHYYEQDGQTALISRTASMLAGKGIIEVNSAGNDGMGSWKRINFPGDAEDNLTVGAMTFEGLNSPFSSVGPTADGRIKPDVMAIGSSTAVIGGYGTILHNNGTSFSCPTIAGMAACLWQALPTKTACEIIDLIRQSGDNVAHPDNIYGYGVPDFWKAYQHGLGQQ